MLCDCAHPRFRNLNSTVPDDVVRVKSYVNSLFNSTRVPVRVGVNKLNLLRADDALSSINDQVKIQQTYISITN